MATFRELVNTLRSLEIDPRHPVIAHASLSAFGQVQGGAETLLGALLTNFESLAMPAFTYKTMLIPEIGPEDNAVDYGSGKSANNLAEFFRPDMPADRLMGVTAEALRRHPKSRRSAHPILSFAGINLDAALESQSLENPLALIEALCEGPAWVLLLGVNHTVNTSIHLGEKQAGRKQFVRWALTLDGVVECPGFPGCSEGFQAIAPHLEEITRQTNLGTASIQAIPLGTLIEVVRQLIAEDPLALLCTREDCGRCNVNRLAVAGRSVQATPPNPE